MRHEFTREKTPNRIFKIHTEYSMRACVRAFVHVCMYIQTIYSVLSLPISVLYVLEHSYFGHIFQVNIECAAALDLSQGTDEYT